MKLFLPVATLAIMPTRRAHMFLHHHDAEVSHPVPVVSEADLSKLLAVKNTIAQTPGAVDSFDATAFDSVISSIRSSTSTNLDNEKSQLGADISGAATTMDQCLTDNACTQGSPKLTALEEEHKECAGMVSSEETEKSETDAACGTSTTKCGQRDAAAHAVNSEMAGETRACTPQQAGAAAATGANFEFANVDVFAHSLLTKHGEWMALQMECVQAEADCAREQLEDVAAGEERIRACGELTTLEAQYKGEYNTCYQGASATFDAKSDYSEIVEGWKVALNQLETLICYIKVGSAHLAGNTVAALPTPTVACAGPDNAFACTCSNPNDPQAASTNTYDLTIQFAAKPPAYAVCAAQAISAESLKADVIGDMVTIVVGPGQVVVQPTVAPVSGGCPGGQKGGDPHHNIDQCLQMVWEGHEKGVSHTVTEQFAHCPYMKEMNGSGHPDEEWWIMEECCFMLCYEM